MVYNDLAGEWFKEECTGVCACSHSCVWERMWWGRTLHWTQRVSVSSRHHRLQLPWVKSTLDFVFVFFIMATFINPWWAMNLSQNLRLLIKHCLYYSHFSYSLASLYSSDDYDYPDYGINLEEDRTFFETDWDLVAFRPGHGRRRGRWWYRVASLPYWPLPPSPTLLTLASMFVSLLTNFSLLVSPLPHSSIYPFNCPTSVSSPHHPVLS